MGRAGPDGLPSIGAVEQPMPTQSDRNTAMNIPPLKWDAACDDARKAGVMLEWSGDKKQAESSDQTEEDD